MPDDASSTTASPGAPTAGPLRTGRRASGPAAVLWDMDGTLVDTEPYWYRAEADLVATHGGRWTQADALAVIGFDLLDSAAYLQRVGRVDMPAAEIVDLMIDRVVEQMADDPPWQPGALDLVAELRAAQVPCVLVTMSWRRLADAVVDLLPPGSFAATVVGDEVSRGKPHPDPYVAAAAAVGAVPHDCVAIEDSPTGVASARAAGCVVVGVPHMVELPAGAVDAVVPTLEGLDLAGLRRLFAATGAGPT
ncbi:MAG TPA: HAD family phosphatase [Acidimicrobiales bacterium]|jgi:HAD superfamily hydrolase (TIGR01509 family)|nr:HAD family phosphatase [Acidimicrobiales bacterium]